MSTAYLAVSIVLALVLGGSAFATLTRQQPVVDSMRSLEVAESWMPWLAALKAAAVVGLLIGIGVPPVGAAAAIGVVLYFTGAITVHLRAGDLAIAVPVAIGLAGVAALATRLASM